MENGLVTYLPPLNHTRQRVFFHISCRQKYHGNIILSLHPFTEIEPFSIGKIYILYD